MANVSDIRFHIKSVKQTRQITNAMHMVSAARMRRALDGISRRFKNKKGPPRPSFIDTGTYQAAMRAWVSGVLNAFPG